MPFTRRAVLAGLAAAPMPLRAGARNARARLAEIEARLGGRLGVALRDRTGLRLGYRETERFPLCSTFKALAAAAILARCEAGRDSLDRPIAFGPGDIQSYGPVTRDVLRDAGGVRAELSLDALCAAAVVWSDNAAANLMLAVLGGPGGLTAWIAGLGDAVTRLDRTEPELNTAIPSDSRDTTSPTAMTATLDACLLGDALLPASRARLEGWMVASRTGLARLRAGLPSDWGVGDKTGTGENGTANVVAILRSPNRPPLIAAVYLTGSSAEAAARDTGHAEVGRILAEMA